MNKKYFLIITAAFVLSLFFPVNRVLAANSSLPVIENPFDSLKVTIPGMARFSEAEVSNTGTGFVFSINWIAEYIMGVYNYAIAIIGVLAVLAIAMGGVMWAMSFGNPSIVTEGKAWITGAILGLVLALGSYILLNTINADLVRMRPINLGHVTGVGDQDPGDEYGGALGDQIPCPPAGSTMDQIVDYYLTQTPIYYTKGPGHKPPEPPRGYMTGSKYYSDCSGFAQLLAKCARLNYVPGEGRTMQLFGTVANNRHQLHEEDDPQHLKDEPGESLKPGDIVGYNDGKIGHVLTYIGGNKLIECGGKGGGLINRNADIKVSDFKERLKSYFADGKTVFYIRR